MIAFEPGPPPAGWARPGVEVRQTAGQCGGRRRLLDGRVPQGVRHPLDVGHDVLTG